jgi:hypothetical protein
VKSIPSSPPAKPHPATTGRIPLEAIGDLVVDVVKRATDPWRDRLAALEDRLLLLEADRAATSERESDHVRG